MRFKTFEIPFRGHAGNHPLIGVEQTTVESVVFIMLEIQTLTENPSHHTGNAYEDRHSDYRQEADYGDGLRGKSCVLVVFRRKHHSVVCGRRARRYDKRGQQRSAQPEKLEQTETYAGDDYKLHERNGENTPLFKRRFGVRVCEIGSENEHRNRGVKLCEIINGSFNDRGKPD